MEETQSLITVHSKRTTECLLGAGPMLGTEGSPALLEQINHRRKDNEQVNNE